MPAFNYQPFLGPQANYSGPTAPGPFGPTNQYQDPNKPNNNLGLANSDFGPGNLADVIRLLFGPRLAQTIGQVNPITEAFNKQTLEPGALFGAASTAATGAAGELFKAGGAIDTAIKGARGNVIGQGFGPAGAVGNENAILQQGVTSVGNIFAQNAGQLESQRYGALAGAYGQGQSSINDLLESIFTGLATQTQSNLAKKQSKKPGLFGLGFGPF